VRSVSKRKRPRIKFRRLISPEPMPAADWEAAERLLAKMIARAYLRDHGLLPAEPGESASCGEPDSVDPERRRRQP